MSKNRIKPRKIKRNTIVYLSLFLISILVITLSFAFYYGPSVTDGFDSYYYSYYGYQISKSGISPSASIPGISGTKIIFLSGIALFYRLFGYNLFSSTFFSVISIILTLPFLYKIGEMLADYRAGILAALLYSVSPIIILAGSSIGDSPSLVLFETASMYLIVYYLKRKTVSGPERNKIIPLFLSGLIAGLGILVVSEIILVLIASIVLLFIMTIRRNAEMRAIAYFSIGAVLAFFIILLVSYAHSYNPLYIFSEINSLNSPPLFSGNITNISANLMQGLAYYWFIFFSNNVYIYMVRPFVLAALGSIVILGLYKDHSAILPSFWLGLDFLGMLLTTSNKALSVIPLPRYSVILFPLFALLIAFMVLRVYSSFHKFRTMNKNKKRIFPLAVFYLVNIIIVAAIIATLLFSIIYIRYVSYSEYRYAYPFIQLGKYLNTLNPNITLASSVPLVLILPFTNYSINNTLRFPSLYEELRLNCSSIKDDSYVITFENQTLKADCGLVTEFNTSYPPTYLSSYTLYNNSGVEPNQPHTPLYVYYKP